VPAVEDEEDEAAVLAPEAEGVEVVASTETEVEERA